MKNNIYHTLKHSVCLFCVQKAFLKNFKFFMILDRFDMMSKINFKKYKKYNFNTFLNKKIF